MSTDLELFQDLDKIKLPKLKIQSSNENGVEIQEENKNQDECSTPNSEENKIPVVSSCPPAPRKPRKRAVSCKRKLSELQFFEIVNREEVDAFFKAGFDGSISKRRFEFLGDDFPRESERKRKRKREKAAEWSNVL
ncbi:cyclin-dependent protein kinase inhibitor SMR1-like [Durio zibethinus]|uniref:Cyclin-dependent protein kinase inhibitor SMR1-like n=1 Tax=Durio zibethinus TaxID=66656 RepID=A0A6P6AHG8_DURZI|nr:cyclin-dependent protein kinase inhibitor SMR1-like [Durio zibethinus]